MTTPTTRDLSLFLARHPSETDKDWAYLLDASRTLAAAEYADAWRLRAAAAEGGPA